MHGDGQAGDSPGGPWKAEAERSEAGLGATKEVLSIMAFLDFDLDFLGSPYSFFCLPFDFDLITI